MPDRTGRALGTLDPVIFFKRADGHILLPPVEIGQGLATTRRLFHERFERQGYMWCEAATLADVDRLQTQLRDQETRIRSAQGEKMDAIRERVWGEIASSLRTRMASSACSPYEREFISLWLQLRDNEKRKQFMQRWTERNDYLWAREMDAATKVQDRMGE